MENHKIRVGETATFTVGQIGDIKKLTLLYSGMPSESRFAVTVLISDASFPWGSKSSSPMIYYNADARYISVFKEIFEVLEVNANWITLAHQKQN